MNDFRADTPDTVERTHSEARIETVRQRGGVFVEAVRATRMPMIVTDATLPGNPIVFANEAFVSLSGYSLHELLGQAPHFMNGERTNAFDIQHYEDAVHDGRDENLEILQYRKDGTSFCALLYATVLRDEQGNVTNHFLSYLDISRRRNAEEGLRILNVELEDRIAARTKDLEATRDELARVAAERELLHEQVSQEREATLVLRDRSLAAIGQGVLITDALQPDRPIIYANPAFERMTGFTAEEVKGRNCRFLQGPGTDPAVVSRIRTAVAAGANIRETLVNYRKDGTRFLNELTVTPVQTSDGRITHLVGIQSDVTERQRLEEQLRQAQKMEALGQLAGGLAHDFNNLATIMLGNAEILAEEASDPETRQTALFIVDAAQRGADLTAQLLAFGRRETMKQEVLDFGMILPGFVALLRRTLGSQIKVDAGISHHPALVLADRSLLETALLNLCLNARDAMPDGGLLSIRVHPHRAEHLPPGEYTCITVSDSGAGMDPDVLIRATEPFFTTKDVGKGSGLGLSMVYGFASQSGGELRIDSEPGKGTSVELVLQRPATFSQAAAEPALVPICDLTGMEVILLVEDEPAVRQYVHRQISRLGYQVLEAENATEALGILTHRPDVDLLLTDVILPGGISGTDLALIATRRFPGLRVLLTSGYSSEHAAQLSPTVDAWPLVRKPYKRNELAEMVRRVLDRAPVNPSPESSAEC